MKSTKNLNSSSTKVNKPTVSTSKQNTAKLTLHSASEKGNKEAVESLLSNNINERNKDGKTPLQLAFENGQKEIVEFLIDKGAKYHR